SLFVLEQERRIMQLIATPQPLRRPRRDGWTPARREQFLEHLAAGLDARRACARSDTAGRGAWPVRTLGPFAGGGSAPFGKGATACTSSTCPSCGRPVNLVVQAQLRFQHPSRPRERT